MSGGDSNVDAGAGANCEADSRRRHPTASWVPDLNEMRRCLALRTLILLGAPDDRHGRPALPESEGGAA